MMYLRPFGKWLMVPMLSMATLIAAGSDAPLADAAERMDRASIRTLLQQPIDVNAPQVDGMTALHWAAYQDDLETVELLVRAGADVKAANRYGVTPLSLACTNANVAMVERLLDAGADPNTALRGGETALMTATRTGKVGTVKALLARGAGVHSKVRGQTALMWAAAEGYAEVVEELIKAGADFRTPLDSGFTPLLFAVREGRIDVVRALLKAGADVNETIHRKDPKQGRGYGGRLPRVGTSALLLAVTNAHFELAATLLDAGADPNADLPGYTALHAITRVRKPGVGDNDPAPQGSGNMSSIEFVKKLAAHGADLNARMTKRVRLGNTRLNEFGATPFLLAAQTADAELMRTLAELGADPLLPNADNSTPLMVAAGLPTRSPGEDAGTESEVLEAVQVALDLGGDVNAVDDNGETAMHGAAYKNLPKVVQFLADKGAKIEIWNQKNKYGWTPLVIAEGYRHGNFKPSPVTVAALHRVMIAAGVSPPTEPEKSENLTPY
ncbi:ankyrin repeat domain-containing protein [Acidobacteria bacterium AH-259-O06]|nr:ankyrin repeat domain-containing protein [Acidobacteria bacterium AH-259-O06]